MSLQSFIQKNPFKGFLESVPAYSSLTFFFELSEVKNSYPQFQTAFEFVEDFLQKALQTAAQSQNIESRKIKIPVCYEAEFAPDLDYVAERAGISAAEVINLHTSEEYRVFMIGFLPAFAYLGEVSEKIATPRRNSPRTNIAGGSVGIAGAQTGIYPLDSPGGWQIIGRTPLTMFQPEKKNISYLRAGDSVSFYQIGREEFYSLKKK